MDFFCFDGNGKWKAEGEWVWVIWLFKTAFQGKGKSLKMKWR